MPAPKTPEHAAGKSASPAGSKSGARKPWKKKTPVEVVMEQAEKLRQEIAEEEEQIKAKRAQLKKFEEARKIFEGA